MKKIFLSGGLSEDIKLENGETVQLIISRSKLGLMGIIASTIFCLLILTVFIAMTPSYMRGISNQMLFEVNSSANSYLYLIFGILYLIIVLMGVVGFIVYRGNRLLVTNKRVIHYSMTAIFARSTNVIDLKSIEDVSFKQSGIIDYVFRLGTIRMSTVGDETTYTFKYIDTPTDEMATITHLLHQAKNIKKAE